MEFVFETHYTAKAMAVMARALRKTLRKKHSRRSHILGWIVAAVGALLTAANFAADLRTVVTAAAVLAIVTALLFEDRINGGSARKHMLPGTERCTTVFSPDGFTSTTEIGSTQWQYDKIEAIAETADYFVFLFDMNHGQVYAKFSLTGGTVDQFRDFIETRTGMPVEFVK